MKTALAIAASLSIAFAACWAQDANSGPVASVAVSLLRTIDVKTSKPGDTVVFRTTQAVNSGAPFTLPKGSDITGRLVAVKRRTDAHRASEIVILLDSMERETASGSHGKPLPVIATIASISRAQSSSPPSAASAGDAGVPSSSPGGPSAASRAGRSGGGMMGPPAGAANTAANSRDRRGEMDSESRSAGSFQLQTTKDGQSIVSSKSDNLRLDAGTQVLLQLTPRKP